MSMSLTIDDQKIRTCLDAATKPAYVVTILHVTPTEVPATPAPSLTISGTVTNVSAPSVRGKDHFALLRRKIEQSGLRQKTVDELDKDIEDIKRRR